jgi:hypothetical protein
MYCYFLPVYSRFTVSCFLSSTYTLWLLLYLNNMKNSVQIIPLIITLRMIINLQFIFFLTLWPLLYTLCHQLTLFRLTFCWKMISSYELNDLSHENYYSEPFINETAAGILNEHSFYNSFKNSSFIAHHEPILRYDVCNVYI